MAVTKDRIGNNMKKTLIFIFTLLLLSSASVADNQPNILLILPDDHAKKAIGCYGNTDIKTPALDRIAREGMRFNHALTPNSFCTPSRAVVLIGKYSHKNGVTRLNQSFDGAQPTSPKLLQDAGYQTTLSGKWHLRSQPTGFDHYCVQKMQGMSNDTIVFETGMKWIPWSPEDRKSYRIDSRVLPGYNNDTITTEAPNLLIKNQQETAKTMPAIFDGKSLDNWSLENGKPVPSGWEVIDGTIHRKQGKKRIGNVVTREQYGDFDLSFEWKIAKGGNSGVKYRVRKYGRKMLGYEYQIFDDGTTDKVPGKRDTGSIYALFEPHPERKINPAGQFNASRIVVRGDHIDHWLNGQLVASATIGSPVWEKRIAESKFNDVPDFGRNRTGRIMLTDHGAEVWYRNLKISSPPAPDKQDIPAKNQRSNTVPPSAPAKPNIILIMADDIAFDNIGCYGSDYFKTPRLDELARTGIKFNHCYSEPVCTASRVKIMTGRDNIRNYTQFGQLDPNEKTFGSMMKEAGYATAIAGKWQLHGNGGALAPDCGFDTFCLWNYPDSERPRYWNPSIIRDGKKVPTTPDSYGPEICTDYLIEFIEKNKNQPFFAYYPMLSVHSPFLPTPDSADRNSTDKNENYREMVSYMDKCVGRLVDTLDRNGLRENTIIIFTTDNGTHTGLKYPYQGEIRTGEKAYPTDGGCHAPLIVNCPGTVNSNVETDDIVDFSDVMPTLAEIGKAQLPNVTLDGRSFWAQCVGETGNPREWIFQYYYPKAKDAAKKHGEGKPYIIWAQDQQYKLYSHGKFIQVKDRHEETNISPGTGSPAAETARKKLQAAIASMPQQGVSGGGKNQAKTPKTKGKETANPKKLPQR